MTSKDKDQYQKTSAELAIYDLSPDEITRRLGMAPDEACRIGDPRPRGTVCKTNIWRIKESQSDIPLAEEDYSGIVERCLNRLLERVSNGGLLDRLAELSREAPIAINVYGYCCEVPNLHFSPDVIRKIARIGAYIDEDFYAVYKVAMDTPEQ
jgi:hypothetical protein